MVGNLIKRRIPRARLVEVQATWLFGNSQAFSWGFHPSSLGVKIFKGTFDLAAMTCFAALWPQSFHLESSSPSIHLVKAGSRKSFLLQPTSSDPRLCLPGDEDHSTGGDDMTDKLERLQQS